MQVCYNFCMKRSDNKSHCPVNFSLESFGDSWSLLIIRDIVYFGKQTFGEFLSAEEGISTNILASRLLSLEKKGILEKIPSEQDKRKEIYRLTDKGLDLIPILLELSGWGAKHDPDTNAQMIEAALPDRETMIELIRDTVRSGGALFAGSDSVMSRLAKRHEEEATLPSENV